MPLRGCRGVPPKTGGTSCYPPPDDLAKAMIRRTALGVTLEEPVRDFLAR
jgi:hypothetical protein